MEEINAATNQQAMSVRIQEVTSEFMRITPTMAKQWLEASTVLKNRDWHPSNRKAFAQAMLRGKFMLNGEPIVFNSTGNILDGHHRLQACVDADVSFESLVVRGISDAAKSTFDTGANRNIADDLTISSPAHRILNRRVQSVLALVLRYCMHNLPPYFKTVPAKREILDNNPAIVEAAAKVNTNKAIVSETILGALYYLGGLSHPNEIDRFIVELINGENLKEGQPAYCLRDYLIQMNTKLRKVRANLNNWEVFRACCVAANRYVAGEELRRIMLPKKTLLIGADPKIIKKNFGLSESE